MLKFASLFHFLKLHKRPDMFQIRRELESVRDSLAAARALAQVEDIFAETQCGTVFPEGSNCV